MAEHENVQPIAAVCSIDGTCSVPAPASDEERVGLTSGTLALGRGMALLLLCVMNSLCDSDCARRTFVEHLSGTSCVMVWMETQVR